jgi:hypothetical protein
MILLQSRPILYQEQTLRENVAVLSIGIKIPLPEMLSGLLQALEYLQEGNPAGACSKMSATASSLSSFGTARGGHPDTIPAGRGGILRDGKFEEPAPERTKVRSLERI